jgi:hypothetical protein
MENAMSPKKHMELKWAVQCIGVLVETRGTARKKDAWDVIKKALAGADLSEQACMSDDGDCPHCHKGEVYEHDSYGVVTCPHCNGNYRKAGL